MASRGSVLNGLRAAARTAQSAGGQPHPNYVSPLLGQYAQWTMGRTGHAPLQLPRDPLEFLTGAFGPLSPIPPIGVDPPSAGSDRPEPRRWQYPVAWNMPIGVPGTEGLKLADFQTLRLYADIYSVARACIQLRKDEILGIGWDIGPTHDASKSMRMDRKAREDFGERRAELLRFFRKPDPNYNDFTTWLEAVLEDVLVIDALSIYLHPSRLPGKGVLGTNLAALDLIAGDTIRPLLDLRGASPAPPNPAYQQYLYGVPRSDLMTVLTGDDIKEMGAPVQEYRGDQLLYLPRNPRTWTPYGQAPLERCIVPVITGLRRQQYQMDFYLEGTIPGMFIAPGDPDMTPNQIRELQDTLNAIAGDQAWKHKIIVLPAGSKVDPQKPPELSDQTDEVLMTEVLMAYSVMPMELGILPRVSAVQSPSAIKMQGEASQDTQERKTLKPDLLWLKNALFDRVIQSICGQKDMEWRWDGIEEDKDEQTQTQILTEQIGAALCSIDEARIELGRDPWGMEITQDPGWATAAGFMPLGAINPDTGLPEVIQGMAPNGVPAIPGSPPGSSRSGRAPAGANVAQPAGLKPASAQTAQRPASGQGIPKPRPGGRQQSPGHDAAAAAERIESKPRPIPKAMIAEIDALRRHLNKGRMISTWETRWIPGHVVASMSEDLAKGLSPDQAAVMAMEMLPKVIPGEVVKLDSTGQAVAAQLAADYPLDSLGWVGDAEWRGPLEVPISKIDTGNRKSWNAWHEHERIRSIEAKIRRKASKGKHIKPAVLVDTPDTPSQSQLIVIDGHHRTLAAMRCGEPVWAWVGAVKTAKGDWDEFHTRQLHQGARPGEDEFADEPHAA